MERKDKIGVRESGWSGFTHTELNVDLEELEILVHATNALIGILQPGSGLTERALQNPPDLAKVQDLLKTLEPPVGIYAVVDKGA